ncbi:hypothetical protein ACEPAF_1785 [Sanghuangporus sanghuang]
MVQLTRSFTFFAALLAASTAVARPLSGNKFVKRQDDSSASLSDPTDLPSDVPTDASFTFTPPTGSFSFDGPAPSGSGVSGFGGPGVFGGDPSGSGLSAVPSGSDFSDFPQPSGIQGIGQPPADFSANGTDPSSFPSGSGFSDFPAPTGSFSDTPPSGTPSDFSDASISAPTESASASESASA